MITIPLVTTALAIWGAILSTCLFIIKLVKLYIDRVKFDTTFTLSYEGSNTVTIVNLYKHPVTISYLSLLIAENPTKPLGQIGTNINSLALIQLKAHESITIEWHTPTVFFKDNPNSNAKFFVAMSVLGRKKPIYLQFAPKF